MGSDGVAQGHLKDMPLSSSYETAMEALSSLITVSKRGDGSNRVEKLNLMFRYIKILDLEERISGLKIIHIAGTKGKGSTCAFSEAILRECGFRTGLFTSPHLIDVRERFRIDGIDIAEDKFLLYFWDCWNQLKENVAEDLPMPVLFQFLTLLAFKIFVFEKVDVAILEVGIGGLLDSTNVVKEPVVCGITSLGMDHMEILGDTLGKIASEKAGIFKPGVPAFTVPQLSEAMDVLQEKSNELKISLKVASPVDLSKLCGSKLSLAGDHQFVNAGLAVAVCRCWLQNTGHSKDHNQSTEESDMPDAFLRGLSSARLPGRAQVVYDTSVKAHKLEVSENSFGDLIFYLDGAHSPESIEACARWFSNAVKVDKQSSKGWKTEESHNCSMLHADKNFEGSNKISKQILLFNCMEMRDPQLLFPRLINTCSSFGVHFSRAIFAPSLSTYNKVDSGASTIISNTSKDLSWQITLQRTWEKIIHGKDAILEENSKLESQHESHGFLYGDPSQKCDLLGKKFACSAVIPSLPATIKWLRDYVKENPSLRVQVLVTGSLHLIGDVLKLLRR